MCISIEVTEEKTMTRDVRELTRVYWQASLVGAAAAGPLGSEIQHLLNSHEVSKEEVECGLVLAQTGINPSSPEYQKALRKWEQLH
jgi:hypothetical protein